MRELIARAGEAADANVRDRLYQISAEARFGFRQALNASEDNEAARVGLRDAIEMMVVYELSHGTPHAAASALAELESPPPELAKRVREALAAEKDRVAHLERLQADLDPQIGRRTRMAVATILGTFWTFTPLATGLMLERYPSFPRKHMYWWTVGVIVIGALVVKWGRESMMKTSVNRRMIGAGMIMFASQFVFEVGGNLANLSVITTAVLHLAIWFMTVAYASAFVEKRLWPSAGAMAIAFWYACVRNDHVWYAMSVANFFLLVNFALAWRSPEEDREYRKQRFRQEIDAIRGRFR
jgi:hypothetical protein